MKLSRRAWAYYFGLGAVGAKTTTVKVTEAQMTEKKLEKAVEDRKYTCTCFVTCSADWEQMMNCPIHGGS